MSDTINDVIHPALWIDDLPFETSAVMDVLRIEGQMTMLVKELLLNSIARETCLADGFEDELITEFRSVKELNEIEAYIEFLNKNHLDERLLKLHLSRPHRIVLYREERWGPRAHTLYLKHKDLYDLITYRRLQSNNADVMQEVFFRLKDREDSWETLARQFPGAAEDADARLGPILVSQIEPTLLEQLRKNGPNIVNRPIILDGQVVVTEVERIEASRFDDNLRTLIIQKEFGDWFEEECMQMLRKLRVPT